MTIGIFGASGFIGKHLVSYLLSQNSNQGYSKRQNNNYKLILLVRDKSKIPRQIQKSKNVELVVGQVNDKSIYKKIVKKSDVLVNLIGIIKETKTQKFQAIHVQHVQCMIHAVKKYNRSAKVVHVSAYGVDQRINTPYFVTKRQAESLLTKSSIKYTILRPAIVWSDNENEGFRKEIYKSLQFPFFVPIFGKGKLKLNIINVDTLVSRIEKVFNGCNRKVVDVISKKEIEYLDFIEQLEEQNQINKIEIFIPLGLIYFSLLVVERAFKFIQLPITSDQLTMLKHLSPDSN